MKSLMILFPVTKYISTVEVVVSLAIYKVNNVLLMFYNKHEVNTLFSPRVIFALLYLQTGRNCLHI